MRFHNLTQRLLGTSARTAALKVLLALPPREFTARQLAREAGVSHPQVLEALRLFEAERFVRQRRVGPSSVWSADPEHFLAERLRGLVTLEAEVWRELVSRLEEAVRQAGAKEAYLFGSVARGTEEPSSDIDVLALFRGQAAAARFRTASATLADAFQRRFGNELQVVAFGDLDLRRRGAKRLVETARREGIRLEVEK